MKRPNVLFNFFFQETFGFTVIQFPDSLVDFDVKTNGCFHFCRINKKSYWETKTRYGGKTEKNKIKVKVSRTKKGAKISHLRSFKKENVPYKVTKYSKITFDLAELFFLPLFSCPTKNTKKESCAK